MPTIHLRIDPVFCGPISIDTVNLIRLLRHRCELSLSDAKAYIDRCVFDGETVAIPIDSINKAVALEHDIRTLSTIVGIQLKIDLN